MKKPSKGVSDKRRHLPKELSQINLNAAGIDVGASSHYAAVPEDRSGRPVREFAAYTADLYRLADWLMECRVETVVMESTGVYRIPLFGVLEERGLEVMLVDPRRIKNVPGRKTDVLDCQWLQQLHTYGLLSGAFRPEADIRCLRSFLRQRSMLVQYASQHIQHMQKALTRMNVKLQHVISDITGKTGISRPSWQANGILNSWPSTGTPGLGLTTRPSPSRCRATGVMSTSSSLPKPWSCTGCIKGRLRSVITKLKPNWSGSMNAATASPRRRSRGRKIIGATRRASTCVLTFTE